MGYGYIKSFVGSIASGASTVSFDIGKSWSSVVAEVGSMTTNAELALYGSSDGTTYRPVLERVNTAPVQYQAVVISTAAVNGFAPIVPGARFVQLRASATVTGGAVINLVCFD